MKCSRTILIAGPFLFGLQTTAMAQMADPARFNNVPSVTVLGFAHEVRVPDEITVAVGATAPGATADEALQMLGAKTKPLISAIKAGGIAEANIAASGPYTEILYKHFYDQNGREIFEKRQPIGYRANYNLTLKSKSFEVVGALLPRIAAADGLVNGVSFAVSDERALRVSLEEKAITDAVARAKRQVAAASAKPGRILQIGEMAPINDGEADLNRPAFISKEPYTRDFGFALLPGQVDISVQRQVVMEILPE